MRTLPAKARDLVIAGTVMAVLAVCWLALGDARFLAFGFLAFGVGALAYALLLWRRPGG